MTLEDFVESVVAGWIPIAWHPAAHWVMHAWRWVFLHLAPVAAILAARRK